MHRIKNFLLSERNALLVLLTAAFAVRAAHALTALVIAKDGPRFTMMAQLFLAGRWDEGLDLWPRTPPLYPLLIACFGSGAAVSVTLGALSILPAYATARAVWDRRTATLAAGVVAFHPTYAALGGDVMCEPAYCFFWFSAVEFVRRAAEHARWRDGILAGLAGGLAALTRPEGMFLLPAVAGWTAVRALRLGGRARRAAVAGTACLVFAAVVFPYARWIHAKTGRWDVSDNPYSQASKFRLGLAKEDGLLDEYALRHRADLPPPPPAGSIRPPPKYTEDRMEAKYGYVLGRSLHYLDMYV